MRMLSSKRFLWLFAKTLSGRDARMITCVFGRRAITLTSIITLYIPMNTAEQIMLHADHT
jgi:hypothetical protein